MSCEVKRNKGESVGRLIRRFRSRYRELGIGKEVRRRKHYEKGQSENQQKAQRVAYLKKQSKQAYLKKIGKLPADDGYNNR